MADEPIPSHPQPLPTNITPGLPDGAVAPGRNAITTAPDGAKGKPPHAHEADKETPRLRIPWSLWFLNLGAQFAFALLLAIFAIIVLWASHMSWPTSGWTAV